MYRKNVMIILKNHFGKYLVAHKANAPKDDWYFPGGGIENNESVQDAFFREIYEELGLTKKDIKNVTISDISHKYDWDEHLKKSTGFEGQKQIIIICNTNSSEIDLTVTCELDKIKWVDFSDLFSIIPHEDLKRTLKRLQIAHNLK